MDFGHFPNFVRANLRPLVWTLHMKKGKYQLPKSWIETWTVRGNWKYFNHWLPLYLARWPCIHNFRKKFQRNFFLVF